MNSINQGNSDQIFRSVPAEGGPGKNYEAPSEDDGPGNTYYCVIA